MVLWTTHVHLHTHTQKEVDKRRWHSDPGTCILTSMCTWHMGSRWYTSDLNVITMHVCLTEVQWCESRRLEEIFVKVSAAMRWQLASRRRLLLIACQVLLKGPEKMVISGSYTAECTYDWLRRCDKEGMDHLPHSADFVSSDYNTCHYLPYITTGPCHGNETNWRLFLV